MRSLALISWGRSRSAGARGENKHFMIDLSNLPPRERAKKYRQFSEDALKWAEASKGQVSDYYRIIADEWRKLADELEATFAKDD
jgi:hypothetical protein